MLTGGAAPALAPGTDLRGATTRSWWEYEGMHAVEGIFAIGWAAFWTYWLLAAFSNKR